MYLELLLYILIAWAFALPTASIIRIFSTPSGIGRDVACIVIECAAIFSVSLVFVYVLIGLLGLE